MSCNRWPMTAKCRIVVCFSFCFCFRVVSDNKCNKIKIISQNENNETPSASNFVHPEGFEGGMCGILPGKWETTRAAGYPAALVVLSLSGLSLFFPAPLPAAAFCSLRPSAFSGPFACCGLLFAATLSPPSLPLAAVSSVGSDRDHVDTDRLKCGFDLGRELVVRDQDVDVFDRADAPESPSSDFRRIG